MTGECWLVGDAYMQYVSYLLKEDIYICTLQKMHSSFSGNTTSWFISHSDGTLLPYVSENGHMFLSRHTLLLKKVYFHLTKKSEATDAM